MTLNSHSNNVESLAVLHNGDLASGSSDNTIKIWNIENGSVKFTLKNHSSDVRALAVLHNGDIAKFENGPIHMNNKRVKSKLKSLKNIKLIIKNFVPIRFCGIFKRQIFVQNFQ
ncbi:serine threonine kinase [Brachionus plicatilis]|uniref:Serine threonine kinase n=1 Tax=Brachionus plicatilis TaxID=10195 RepID=A0A3M7QL56_BRAPC|nr:serine threonine kinase [Brachionus plicatilis]